MKSAGNDIIALNAVNQQRTISPQFYTKFIIPAERELYEQSSVLKTVSFCSFVWMLWSVKESAYKYVKRLQPDLIFPPSKFVIESIDSSSGFLNGVVSFQDIKLHYRSWITNEYISTVVNDSETFGGVYHEVIKIADSDYHSQSTAVRQLAMQKLNEILAADDLIISKTSADYPVILQGKNELDIPISFAHHDKYVGYSFKITP